MCEREMLSLTAHPSHPAKVKWTRCEALARCRGATGHGGQAKLLLDDYSGWHCLPALYLFVCELLLPADSGHLGWGGSLFSQLPPQHRGQRQTLSRNSGNLAGKEGGCWTQNSSKKPSLCWEDDSEGCHGNQRRYCLSALQLTRYIPIKIPLRCVRPWGGPTTCQEGQQAGTDVGTGLLPPCSTVWCSR